MATEYESHEVANLFPMMDPEAFGDLCSDIKENGLREPIWLHEGKIIDGRNRYKACLEAGVKPEFRTWDGKGSLVSFVVSLNLHRRHLTPSQLKLVAHEMRPHLEAEAKERQREHGGTAPGRKKESLPADLQEVIAKDKTSETAVIAAKLVGTSTRGVYQVGVIEKEAPEKIEEIRQGKVTVDKVYRELRPGRKTESPPSAVPPIPPAKPKPLVQSPADINAPRIPCTEAMQFATIAIMQLERIRVDDPKKIAALLRVRDFIDKQLVK